MELFEPVLGGSGTESGQDGKLHSLDDPEMTYLDRLKVMIASVETRLDEGKMSRSKSPPRHTRQRSRQEEGGELPDEGERAAKVIQRRVREGQRVSREKATRESHAALVIKRSVRRRLQSQQEGKAAKAIQRRVRQRQSFQHEREEHAASVIQGRCKRFYSDRNEAAFMIQGRYHKHLKQRQNKAAAAIQHVYRRSRGRGSYASPVDPIDGDDEGDCDSTATIGAGQQEAEGFELLSPTAKPDDWQAFYDSNGRLTYYNSTLDEVQLEKPEGFVDMPPAFIDEGARGYDDDGRLSSISEGDDEDRSLTPPPKRERTADRIATG
ncbi:unnamed protein product [Chrysoparadoxa australica]